MPTTKPLAGEDLGIHGMQSGAERWMQTAMDAIPIAGFRMGDKDIPPGQNYVRDPSLITTDAQGRQVTPRWNTGQAGINNHFGRNVALMMLAAAAGGVGLSAMGAGAVGEGTALAGAGIGADESLGLAMGNPFTSGAATAGAGAFDETAAGFLNTGAPNYGATAAGGSGAGYIPMDETGGGFLDTGAPNYGGAPPASGGSGPLSGGDYPPGTEFPSSGDPAFSGQTNPPMGGDAPAGTEMPNSYDPTWDGLPTEYSGTPGGTWWDKVSGALDKLSGLKGLPSIASALTGGAQPGAGAVGGGSGGGSGGGGSGASAGGIGKGGGKVDMLENPYAKSKIGYAGSLASYLRG